MDALTWFKSVFGRAPATSDRLRPEVAAEPWPDVPLHLAAARLRPAPPPAAADGDWDAVIARARMQAASPKTPNPTPPSMPRHAPRAPSPPPAPPAQQGTRRPPAVPPFPPARRAAPEMQETPPPSRARQTTPLSMARLKALRLGAPATARANVDLVAWGSLKKLAASMAAAARRPAEADQATPPPVANVRRAASLFGPAKRS